MNKTYEDGVIDGHMILVAKIEVLLSRRKDLDFDWRNDLQKALDDSYVETVKIDNGWLDNENQK
jgi:hypothetical protein